MATRLENSPENRCIGCGPENPLGLHLAFERDGDAIRTSLDATREREGWPDRMHSAILYLAMLETANWTVFGLKDRVGLPTKTSGLAATRWIATGETLVITGRVASETPLSVHVTATDALGRDVATLTREYDLPDRATFLRRMGYDAVPPGLEDVLPE